MSLNYVKGADNNDKTGVDRADRWLPWTDVLPATGSTPNRFARADLPSASYPQPWLTGIEFDVDGSIILGIRDRSGDQFGNNNYGPNATTPLYRIVAPGNLLRASKCIPRATLWTLESNASVCGGTATAGANNGQGPGNGEYYYIDVYSPFHNEIVQGGLAQLPGSGEVASVVLDPTDNIESGGIRRFKNSDGSSSAATSLQVYVSNNVATYGKANGLGDLELSLNNPTTEIGNRVWFDTNKDGIQDAGETVYSAVSGLTIQLLQNGSVIATTTVAANGTYLFSSATIAAIQPNTAYQVRLVPPGNTTLGYTIPTAQGGTNPSLDSDASLLGVISLTTGGYGANNHTYDIGVVSCSPSAAALTSSTICNGTSATLTASGGTSYTFSNGTTNTAGILIVSPSTTTTFSVSVSNGTSCSAVASGTITVNPAVTATVSASPSSTVCSGTTVTLTASGGTNYRWSTGATTAATSVTHTSTTTYSVTVTNAGGCSAVVTPTVTVNPSVTVAVASQTICNGMSATLTANATGGSSFTYRWNTGATTATLSVSPTATTTCAVTVTNNTGCFSTTSATVTVNPAVTATITASPGNTICNGTSTTLTASGGTAYIWSTGATTAAITVSPASTTAYSVTVTNASGCVGTTSTTVTINPAVTATVANATVCNGTSATLTANASGGSGFTYAWAPASTGSTQSVVVNPSTTMTYSVTVTNSNGCSTVSTATITVNPSVTATLTSATICRGASTNLVATGGAGHSTASATAPTSQPTAAVNLWRTQPPWAAIRTPSRSRPAKTVAPSPPAASSSTPCHNPAFWVLRRYVLGNLFRSQPPPPRASPTPGVGRAAIWAALTHWSSVT